MKILEALRNGEEGAVLVDENSGIVRLWTLTEPFCDVRTMRALKRFFPYTESKGEFLRLAGVRSVQEANAAIADAKTSSFSPAVQHLFRYDVPESLATLKHIS